MAKSMRTAGAWLLDHALLFLNVVLGGIAAWYGWLALGELPDALDHVLQPIMRAALKESFDPLIAGMEFALSVQEDKQEAAYGLTSQEFQRRHSLAEFAGLVDQNSEFGAEWVNVEGAQPDADTYLFSYTTEMDNRRRFTITLRLRKEDGKWKVDEIVLP